jgi:hypothetical protein
MKKIIKTPFLCFFILFACKNSNDSTKSINQVKSDSLTNVSISNASVRNEKLQRLSKIRLSIESEIKNGKPNTEQAAGLRLISRRMNMLEKDISSTKLSGGKFNEQAVISDDFINAISVRGSENLQDVNDIKILLTKMDNPEMMKSVKIFCFDCDHWICELFCTIIN